MSQALLGIGAVLAAVFWIGFCWRDGESFAKSAIKTGAVAVLALAALSDGAPWALVLALSFGAAGDYALSRIGDRWFLAGLGCFALAHLAFAALFFPEWDLAALDLLTAGAITALAAVMATMLWRRAGALRGPVMAYVAIILAMGWAAMGLPGGLPRDFARLGALLFILSDAVLAAQLFLLEGGRLRRVAPLLVWPLYWLAQAGIFLGFTWG